MGAIRVVAIIPARMASTRLPGKPLLEIAGLPMIEHVRRRTLLCRSFAEVVVATCDRAIAEVVARYGGRCLMTSPDHPAATDRVSEAMQQLDCTHVVNVQGDEILVLPSDLERIVKAITQEPHVPAWNAVARIEETSELGDSSIVKGILSSSGRILYCARDLSVLAPHLGGGHEPIHRILGILAYRRDFLEQYGRLTRTPLEQAEAIDQLRILEHDVMLRAVAFSRGYPGINEPREVTTVTTLLEQEATQQLLLQEISAPSYADEQS